VTKAFNLAGGPLGAERDRDGWRVRSTRVGDELGSRMIGGSIYELPSGERSFPFHYHHGVEEWLLVVSGTPSVRTPSGTQKLEPGDVLCFPPGAEGAHDVTGPGRVLIVSSGGPPSISVYPESDKLGTRSGDADDTRNFRRADAVDYWEGEE
jgi:uncharacterized cupin superfamily protein